MIFIKLSILSAFYSIVNGNIYNTSTRGLHYLRTPYLPQQCGQSRYDVDIKKMRIIQGDVADLGEFPWIARLGRRHRDRDTFFFCGASLINRYYVLSAAHCEEKGDVVRLGENYQDTYRDCDDTGDCAPPPQDIEVKAYKYYGYCSPTLTNDISLIELKTPAKFNDFVQPICLKTTPLTDEYLFGKIVSLAGWGNTIGGWDSEPNHLMYITAPILDREPCSRRYTYTPVLLESQLCIGHVSGFPAKDSCTGDSGGPVFMYLNDNGAVRAYLVGIVSYGLVRCGYGPAVYTNVGHYVDLLLEDINKS